MNEWDSVEGGQTAQSRDSRTRSRDDGETLDEQMSLLLQEIGRRKAAEAALTEHRERLRRLVFALTLAEERQRREFADHLHDSIGQKLAAARMRLEQARQLPADTGERQLELAARILDSAVQHVQTLTRDLGASVLYHVGLPAALRSWGGQVAQVHALEFSFQQCGDYERRGWDLEVQILRSVRELVSNVVQHAQASRLRIALDVTAKQIVVQVADDGRGFPAPGESPPSAGPGCGLGLFSMRERLTVLGGSLELQSTPGGGTIAVVTVPCAAPNAMGEQGS